MKYIRTFKSRGPVLVDDGVTAEVVAADSREAALAFMSGVARGWTKHDLVAWLEGEYAHATRHCRQGERAVGVSLQTRGPLDPLAIERLLTSTRATMIAMLVESLSPTTFEFAHDAVRRNLVHRASDENLEPIWLPIDAARMRLRDRVCSLFAAHRLNDPATHAALFVCPQCDELVFDEHAQQLGRCGSHRQVSGIDFRGSSVEDLAVGVRK